MKFSVLLPTRNGGPFLHNCIASVLEQPYPDMELVVSDNANTDETSSVIASFASDPRLKSIRLEEPVPVTENWRAALDASEGDYILLIGDDDCLLPGYFERMTQVVEQYDEPECIAYNGYGYVFPQSAKGNQSSYYADPRFSYGPEFREGLMSREMRLSIVRDMFRFKIRYPVTSQLSLISRRVAARIEGSIFQPPFPDHYAISASLLEAETFAYCPEKLIVTGASPKSYTHFSFNDLEGQGMNYLGIDPSFEDCLPGSDQINAMYVWLEKLKEDFPAYLEGVSISRAGYVRHQMFAWYQQLRAGSLTYRTFLARCRMLSARDWLGLSLEVFDQRTRSRLLQKFHGERKSSAQAKWPELERLDGVDDIRQFAAFISANK